MQSLKNQKIVYVNKGARPSRFLVDLLKVNEPKPEPKKNFWEKFLLHFRKKEKHVKRLAFFSLFKAIFVLAYRILKLVYRFCFWCGFGFLFVIRFFGISVFKIFNFLFKTSGEKDLPSSHNPLPVEKEIVIEKQKVAKKRFRPFTLFPTPLRPLVNFILILIAIILPLKAFTSFKDIGNLKLRVIDATSAAIGDIKSASISAADKDFGEAGKDFSLASKNFLDAKKEISDLNVLLNIVGSVIPNNDIRLAKDADLILEAGRLSSEIGADLSAALSVFNQDDASLEAILNGLNEKSESLISNIALLDAAVKKINADVLPVEYKDTFLALREKSDLINGNVKEFFEIIKLARTFLGFEQDKRYLFVFQNNTELRASGGFIGSYAIVDFRNGEIIKMDVPGGGSYDTEGALRERIIAPAPLALVNPLWHFWDANWWPDWPTSAAKLAWFYEKSGGSTVDGVISFTPTVLERLLEIIGPLDMTEKYGVTITAENFWQIVQVLSEQKPEDHPDYLKYLKLRAELFKDSTAIPPMHASGTDVAIPEIAGTASTSTNQAVMEKTATGTAVSETADAERHEPKKIIGDMFEKIRWQLKENLNKETFFALAGFTLNSLNEKHILFYFNDSDLQAKAEAYAWTGEMKESAWDYLMVVNSNIAGAKTDRVIEEEISHKAEVAEDGTITDTVEIIRRHNGVKGDAFTGVRNVNWLRVYVPQGSQLLSASGFRVPDEKFFEQPDASWLTDEYLAKTEGSAVIDGSSGTKIYTEAGKTVFANWCMSDPGETIVIRFKYILPFKLLAEERVDDFRSKFAEFMNPGQKELIPYALMAQKQPGTLGSKFISDFVLSDNFKPVWRYGGEDGNKYIGDLTIDRYRAVLVEKN